MVSSVVWSHGKGEFKLGREKIMKHRSYWRLAVVALAFMALVFPSAALAGEAKEQNGVERGVELREA